MSRITRTSRINKRAIKSSNSKSRMLKRDHTESERKQIDNEDLFVLSTRKPALRALLEVYRKRDDLVRTFPEVVRGNIQGLLYWAVTSGITVDSVKNLLEPYKENLVKLHRATLIPLEKTKLTNLYSFVSYLGEKFGCRDLITIGCEDSESLKTLSSKFNIIGVGSGSESRSCRRKLESFGRWTKSYSSNIEKIPDVDLKRTIIFCSNITKHLDKIDSLVNNVKIWLEHSPIMILSGIETLHVGTDKLRKKPSITEKLNLYELEKLLVSKGINIAFTGYITGKIKDTKKRRFLTLVENNASSINLTGKPIQRAPPDFRVVALMRAYNEEDIVESTLNRLISQGIQIYFFDNWSTDATYEIAKRYEGQGVINVERYPADGPSEYNNSWEYYMHVERTLKKINADWFTLYDVDEVRTTPWPGINLRDGVYLVDRAGFNSIDHTVIEFPPTDNAYISESDFEAHFKYFLFPTHQANFMQVKTWKNYGQDISIAQEAGHIVSFKGKRVFPYKFLLKHYPIRSQEHGRKKIFLERLPRYHPLLRSIGWMVQYDHIKGDHEFLYDFSELELFDEATFNRNYLIQRLSGIGILE